MNMPINTKVIDFAIAKMKEMEKLVNAFYKDTKNIAFNSVMFGEMKDDCVTFAHKGVSSLVAANPSATPDIARRILLETDIKLKQCEAHGDSHVDVVFFISGGKVLIQSNLDPDVAEPDGFTSKDAADFFKENEASAVNAICIQAHTLSGIVVGYMLITGEGTLGSMQVLDPRENELISGDITPTGQSPKSGPPEGQPTLH
jgi:hypothetical protein